MKTIAIAPEGQRGDTTRAAIIDAAEKLIAAYGPDGVSFRQIRLACGSSNTNAVTYHFGDRNGLIEAVIKERHPLLEHYRRPLLLQADTKGRGNDISVLLHAIWYPYFELRNADGRHSYAAFLSKVARTHGRWLEDNLEDCFPIEWELRRRLFLILPEMSHRMFAHRARIIFAMIAAALQCCDEDLADDPARALRVFESAMRMSVAALLTS
jgi:AcrR family transcriptional regulator